MTTSGQNPGQGQAPRPMQINLEIPPDLAPIYANFALIAHAPSEIVIDLACLLPNAPRHKVQARVVMTPLHAKLLARALAENLAKYEAQFGEITIPDGPSLADALFRPRPSE